MVFNLGKKLRVISTRQQDDLQQQLPKMTKQSRNALPNTILCKKTSRELCRLVSHRNTSGDSYGEQGGFVARLNRRGR